MATPSSPFAFLAELFDKASSRLQPPGWAVHEIQHRTVLFLNHVLQQEPEAQARLKRQQGQVVEVRWRSIFFRLSPTPAGLLDLARVIGDVPAHAIGNAARKMVAGLRQFVDKAARTGSAAKSDAE